ncbi:hypothetical protein TNCV_1944131 [Trichonephila clavipes]|nr:hypothetical protein TNCV_1944131 [Trichonephila clavipes]
MDCVYIPPLPADIPDLRHRSEEDVARNCSDTLNKVWGELAYRLDVCRVTNGAHIKHLTMVASCSGPRALTPRATKDLPCKRDNAR